MTPEQRSLLDFIGTRGVTPDQCLNRYGTDQPPALEALIKAGYAQLTVIELGDPTSPELAGRSPLTHIKYELTEIGKRAL